jgi:hypothetical protein
VAVQMGLRALREQPPADTAAEAQSPP